MAAPKEVLYRKSKIIFEPIEWIAESHCGDLPVNEKRFVYCYREISNACLEILQIISPKKIRQIALPDFVC
jgi:hypothetical protein